MVCEVHLCNVILQQILRTQLSIDVRIAVACLVRIATQSSILQVEGTHLHEVNLRLS